MVIVHPAEVAGSAVPGDRFGITLVYRLVRLPEGWLEVAEVLQIMKQRPDDLVGIAKVKLVAFCFAQRYRQDTVAYATGGFGERRVRDLACDPRPGGWKQERGDSLGASLANEHQISQMESRITTLIAPRSRARSRLNSIADIPVFLIFA